MEEKLSYFSIELLNSMDARGERERAGQQGDRTIVYRENHIDYLVKRIDEVDPDGKRAHRISDRLYSTK